MTKALNFPTQEWLDNWVDKWLEDHPTEKVSDFSELTSLAEAEWWDAEIEKGNPTPYDLTKEQEKVSKSARTTHEYKKAKEPVKRVRKPNEEKREIIQQVLTLFPNAEIVNAEREISFKVGENSYSLTLTCHRKPKN